MSPINVNVPPPVPETKTEAKTETETKDPKPVETDETVTKLKEEEAKRQEQDEKEEKERALVEEGKIEELKKTAKTDEEMAAVEKLETAEAARKEEFRTAQEKKRQAALLAISKAGEQAAKGLSDMGLARAKAAESYRQQKMEFLKEKLKIQEEERKNLVNMAEYATRMTQAADAKGIEENIIQSLSQAIGALRRISVILRNNAQFWTQMATACEKLGGQKTEGLRRDINRYKGKPERLCVATSRHVAVYQLIYWIPPAPALGGGPQVERLIGVYPDCLAFRDRSTAASSGIANPPIALLNVEPRLSSLLRRRRRNPSPYL